MDRAVVVTRTVTSSVVVPSIVTEEGDTLQLDLSGALVVPTA